MKICLIVVCGLPGIGKTKVAQVISKRLKIPLFGTDEIRKKLFKKPKYTRFEKRLVYKVMFLITEEFLKRGISVILDATFSQQSSREEVKKIAKKYKTLFKIIEIKCDEKVLLSRIEKRIKGGDLSDADKEIYFKIKQEFEPIRERHIIIDNSRGLGETKEQIKKFLKIFSVI